MIEAPWKTAIPELVDSPTVCEWYHTMDIPGFGTQVGQWDLRHRWHDYVGGIDVAGKRILDVGTSTGWVAFEAERNGATDVIAFDAADYSLVQRVPHRFSPGMDSAEDCAASFEAYKRGFWLAHRLYKSRVRAVYGNIYEIGERITGVDIAIVGQILVHLRDPLGALNQIAMCAKDKLIIVEGSFQDSRPLAVFLGGSAENANQDSWFHLSSGFYRDYLEILGFAIERVQASNYYRPYEGRQLELWTFVAQRFAPTDLSG